MKDINKILAGYGEGLTDEQVTQIIEAVNANYKTINDYTKKTDRLAELEKQNEALTEQVGNLEGSGEEVERLRAQVEQFQTAETERKEKEAEAQKREAFRAVFDAAVGEREFANDLMRESIFERVYSSCQDNAGTGAKEKLEELTKDVSGVWKNPQQDINKMPDPADVSKKKPSSDDAKKTFAEMLFSVNR